MDIIKHLDELRAKATQGEWRIDDEDGNLICNDDVLSVDMRQSDINYIAEMHNALPTLRQAVLEREALKQILDEHEKTIDTLRNRLALVRAEGRRYKAAGAALAKAVDEQAGDTDYPLNNALSAFRTAIDDSKDITQRHEISGNASHVSVSGAEDWSYDGKRPENGAVDLKDDSSK